MIEIAALEEIVEAACAKPASSQGLLQLAERFVSARLGGAAAESSVARSLDAVLGPIESVQAVSEADVTIFGQQNKAAVRFKEGLVQGSCLGQVNQTVSE